MRKNIVFGSVGSVFLLLMIPNISAFEYTQTVIDKNNDIKILNEIYTDPPNPTPSILILIFFFLSALGVFMIISLLLIIYAIMTEIIENIIIIYMSIIEWITEILKPEILNLQDVILIPL
jgi:hypothetical protein